MGGNTPMEKVLVVAAGREDSTVQQMVVLAQVSDALGYKATT